MGGPKKAWSGFHPHSQPNRRRIRAGTRQPHLATIMVEKRGMAIPNSRVPTILVHQASLDGTGRLKCA
jgi:hypothetical protein